MTNWHKGPMVGFDTETTGVDVENDRIVTACIALVDGTGGRKPETAETLIDPGVEIPEQAARIHGITTERARAEGVPARDGVEFVTHLLATALLDEPAAPLVAMNAPFDLTILDRECRRYGLHTLHDRLGDRPLFVVDPMVIDKQIDTYRSGKRTLTHLCQHYGVRLDGAHDSSQDALAACRLAWVLARKKPIDLMTLQELHAWQVAAKATQAASFREYRRKQGKAADDVSGEWPIQAYERQQAIA